MIIRKAKQKDKETLWLIQTQAIRKLGTNYYSPEQIEAWTGGLTPEESHNRLIEGYGQAIEHGTVLVAEDIDSTVVGFATLHTPSGEVGAIYVLPDYARRGIGRQLIEALEEEARRLGVDILHVKASLNAVAFYERVGFRSEHEALHRFRSGLEILCAIITKDLQTA